MPAEVWRVGVCQLCEGGCVPAEVWRVCQLRCGGCGCVS